MLYGVALRPAVSVKMHYSITVRHVWYLRSAVVSLCPSTVRNQKSNTRVRALVRRTTHKLDHAREVTYCILSPSSSASPSLPESQTCGNVSVDTIGLGREVLTLRAHVPQPTTLYRLDCMYKLGSQRDNIQWQYHKTYITKSCGPGISIKKRYTNLILVSNSMTDRFKNQICQFHEMCL